MGVVTETETWGESFRCEVYIAFLVSVRRSRSRKRQYVRFTWEKSFFEKLCKMKICACWLVD